MPSWYQFYAEKALLKIPKFVIWLFFKANDPPPWKLSKKSSILVSPGFQRKPPRHNFYLTLWLFSFNTPVLLCQIQDDTISWSTEEKDFLHRQTYSYHKVWRSFGYLLLPALQHFEPKTRAQLENDHRLKSWHVDRAVAEGSLFIVYESHSYK